MKNSSEPRTNLRTSNFRYQNLEFFQFEILEQVDGFFSFGFIKKEFIFFDTF